MNAPSSNSAFNSLVPLPAHTMHTYSCLDKAPLNLQQPPPSCYPDDPPWTAVSFCSNTFLMYPVQKMESLIQCKQKQVLACEQWGKWHLSDFEGEYPICHLIPTHNGVYICLKSEALREEMCTVEKRLYDLIYQSKRRTTLITPLVTKIPTSFEPHKRKASNSNWGPWLSLLKRPTANLDSEFLLISSTDLLLNKVCLAIIGKL